MVEARLERDVRFVVMNGKLEQSGGQCVTKWISGRVTIVELNLALFRTFAHSTYSTIPKEMISGAHTYII